jgi:isopenicillin-N N-acyltransferase-like protein
MQLSLDKRQATRPYRLVDVSGNAFERGFQFGRACGDMIERYPAVLRKVLLRDARLRDPSAKPKDLDREELERRALRFLPFFEAFAPEQVEEIRGLAAGAEVPFGTALLVNVRGEVGVFDRAIDASAGCTAFAVGREATADGGVLIGQNQDQGQIGQDLVAILRVEPDRGPRLLMATFGGLLGYGGINSAGVGMMQNAVANSTWRFAMPHYPLKRALVEQESIAGCLAVLERARVGSSTNYVLVDRTEILDVESTPDGYSVLRDEGGCIAHSNNFLDRRLAEDDCLVREIVDSPGRYRRLSQLQREKRGGITLEDAKSWLSDHDQHPSGICRHGDPDQPTMLTTMYSVICEPDKGLMHVAAGNPCVNPFHTYSLD